MSIKIYPAHPIFATAFGGVSSSLKVFVTAVFRLVATAVFDNASEIVLELSFRVLFNRFTSCGVTVKEEEKPMYETL